MNQKQSSKNTGQDGSKTSGDQDFKEKYKKDKVNAAGKEVKNAVRFTGSSLKKAEDRLK